MRLDKPSARETKSKWELSTKHVSNVRPWKSISVVVDSSYDLYVDVPRCEIIILQILDCYTWDFFG